MSTTKRVSKQAFTSDRVVLPEEDGGVQPALIIIADGKIQEIIRPVDETTISNLINVSQLNIFTIFQI